MNVLIRDVPADVHKHFKLLCVHQDISMNKKLLELMHREIEESEDERRQIAQAMSKGLRRTRAKK
jgi:signal transduction histidine kinase